MMNNLLSDVKALLERACEAKVFPGCAAGIISCGGSEIVTSGSFTYDDGAPKVTEQSIYDVASITKAIPVACTALKLIELGKLSPDDRLITFVPDFHGSFRDDITITHLLTHTLDFDLRLSSLKECSKEEVLNLILNVALKSRPGERFRYANATSILLGLVLESCSGKKLDTLGNELFFRPLGMSRTGFDPSLFATDEQIVPSEIDPWRGGLVRGQVHDESAWKFRPRVVGSAGLFSTITDILAFVKALLQSFTDSEGALLRKDIASRIITNQRPLESGECTGSGWELNQESFMGKFRSASTFGKTGFTGCSIVADPLSMKAVILLSNHIFPKRRENRDEINCVRRALADLLLSNS